MKDDSKFSHRQAITAHYIHAAAKEVVKLIFSIQMSFWQFMPIKRQNKQEAQLSQRDRATLCAC